MSYEKLSQADKDFLAKIDNLRGLGRCDHISVTIDQSAVVLAMQKGRVAVSYGDFKHSFPQGERDISKVMGYIEGLDSGLRIGKREGERAAQRSMLTAMGVDIDDDGTLRFN